MVVGSLELPLCRAFSVDILVLQLTLIDFMLALQWNPKSTKEVTQESLDLIFKPFNDAEELQLPLENEPR